MSVNDQADHYAVLGLDPSAHRSAIEGAVERLARDADLLAYTAPQRSREVWARIRQIRADLLGDDARRQAYDRTLLPPAVQSRGKRSSRAVLAALIAGAAILALMALAAGPLTAGPAPHLTPRLAALVLSTAGARHGNAYLSGETVRLRWSGWHGSSIYRLQIASSTSPTAGLTIFSHPMRTVLTDRPDYALKVVGAQIYHWRVQAYAGGRWARYSAPRHFTVDRPPVGVPTLAMPADGSVLAGNRVHLCWSTVPGEAGYRLRIDRVGAMRARAACVRLTLHPGTYRWSVAALVQGAHLYMGKYSSSAHFSVRRVVRIARRATRRPATVQIVALSRPRHARKTQEIALAPARHTPRPKSVRHVSTSRHTSSGTSIRRTHRKVTRTSSRAGGMRKRSRHVVHHAAVRRTTHRTLKRRRRARRVTTNHTSRRSATTTRRTLRPPPPPPLPAVAGVTAPKGGSAQPVTSVPLVLSVPAPAPVSGPAVVPAPVSSTPLYVVPSPAQPAPVPVVRAAQVPVQVVPTPLSPVVVSAQPGDSPHTHPTHPPHPSHP